MEAFLACRFLQIAAGRLFLEDVGMGRKGGIFAGCTVALVTPFRDGAVDEAALRALVEWHIEQGTHAQPGGHDR